MPDPPEQPGSLGQQADRQIRRTALVLSGKLERAEEVQARALSHATRGMSDRDRPIAASSLSLRRYSSFNLAW